MTPLYALLRDRCGLSLREAAAFHRVSINTVTKWSSGDRNAPPGILAELRELFRKIDDAAGEIIDGLDGLEDDIEIEIGLAADDHEAQSIGWPCVGAHAAAIGIAAASINNPVVIVPRGSTPATAGAADIHDKKARRP